MLVFEKSSVAEIPPMLISPSPVLLSTKFIPFYALPTFTSPKFPLLVNLALPVKDRLEKVVGIEDVALIALDEDDLHA